MDNSISTKKLIARISLRILIVAVILLICIKFGNVLMSFFLPFILAYFVSAMFLMPVIRKLSGKFEHFRRFWAIVFVVFIMAIAALILMGICYYLITQISDMVRNWEYYRNSLDDLAKTLSELISSRTSLTYDTVLNYIYSLADKVVEWVTNDLPGLAAPTLVDGISSYAPTVGNFFLGFLFFLMATYFICADYPIIRNKLKSAVPESMRPHISQIKKAAGSAAFGYVRAQFIVSGLVSLIAFTVFLIIGQNYASLFAILVGLVDFIPLLGSGAILIPWTVMLVITGNYIKAIVLCALTVALFLFRRIVEPKIVGDQTGLHPLVSLISLYIGIKFGGILGMIMAPILCMIFIGLYNVGFFKPTMDDIKLLIARASAYTEMK